MTNWQTLLTRAEALNDAKKYQEAIDLLTPELLKKYPRAELYAEKARGYYMLGSKEECLIWAKKAIAADANYYKGWNYRGNVRADKKDFDKAIQDYSRAIELKPDFATAFNNRGLTWYLQKDFEKAQADYDMAIKIDPQNFAANRNLGRLWQDRGNREKAIEYYEKAIKLEPDDFASKYWLEELGGKEKQEDAPKGLKVADAIAQAIREIPHEEQAALVEVYDKDIKPQVNSVREHACSNINTPMVCHYTNLKVADILVMNKKQNQLRYSNIAFVNDPLEGLVFLDCLEPGMEEDERPIREAFESGQRGEESNMYIGSFLPAEKGHIDELLMWRTYGKDENGAEAAGCNLIIDIGFFDVGDGGTVNRAMQENIEAGDKRDFSPQPLYKVQYYNKWENKITNNDSLIGIVDLLSKALLKMIDMKQRDENKPHKYKKDSPKNKAIDKIVYLVVSELRFFFKSSDFAYENELRVIQFAGSASDRVEIDKISPRIPRRTYVHSNNNVLPHLRQIILGPRVPNPQQWMYLEAQMKKHGYAKIEMIFSGCKFQ